MAIFFALLLDNKQKSGAYTLCELRRHSAVLRTLLRYAKRSQSNLRQSSLQASLQIRFALIITDLWSVSSNNKREITARAISLLLVEHQGLEPWTDRL